MTRAVKGLALAFACANALGAGGAATAFALASITIAGKTVEGATLTAKVAGIGAKSTVTYEWQRCTPAEPAVCSPIADARATAYTLTAADVGSRIAVAFEVRNQKEHLQDSGTSQPTAVIAPLAPPEVPTDPDTEEPPAGGGG